MKLLDPIRTTVPLIRGVPNLIKGSGNAVRANNEGFNKEKFRYVNHLQHHLRDGALEKLPEVLKSKVFSMQWPIDMIAPTHHLTNLFEPVSFPKSMPILHPAIDIQTQALTPVHAIEDGDIVKVKKESRGSLADVFVYSSNSRILWVYSHLDIFSVLKNLYSKLKIDVNNLSEIWFPGTKELPAETSLQEGCQIGSVAKWPFILNEEVKLQPEIEQVYGRSVHHLDLAAYYLPEMMSIEQLVSLVPSETNAVNPLLLLRKLYSISNR